jgi:simple sugar transport system substrate-binding protein
MNYFNRKLRGALSAGLVAAAALTALPAAAEEEKTMAVVVKVAGDPWWSRLEEGLNEYAAANSGIRVFMQGISHADAALQAQLIEDLVAQNVNALGIVPISPQTLEPVITKAREQGIVVVTHEGETQPTKDYDIEAFDNAAYGVHLMDALAARMGEEGEYAVFVGRLTNVSQNIWVDAAVAHQKEKYPNMTLVGDRIESGEDAATAYRKTLEERTTVVSTSLVSLTRDLLETGAVDMISFWDPKAAGQAMMEAAVRKMNGQEINSGDDLGVEGYNSVTVVGDVVYGAAWVDVTAENMDQYDF